MSKSRSSAPHQPEVAIFAIGPAWGGIVHTFAMTVDLLRNLGYEVDAVNAGTGRSELRGAISLLWRNRKKLRGRIIFAEFGAVDVGVFWTSLLAMWGGHQIVWICHDPPGIVSRAGAAALARTSRLNRAFAYRVASPLLDTRLVADFLKRAGVAIVLSESAQTTMREIGVRDVLVAPHVSLENARMICPPEKSGYVLFAGYLGPNKGLDLLLEAWHRAQIANLRLVIAGGTDENYWAWLNALRERYEADTNPPIWLGNIPDEESFAEVIGSAAAVVLPYRSTNPASGILVRAMSMGRCVIASRIGTFAQSIVDEENGLLVEPEDVDALAHALARVAEDRDLRARLGAAAGESAKQLFSHERYQAVLREAIELATHRQAR